MKWAAILLFLVFSFGGRVFAVGYDFSRCEQLIPILYQYYLLKSYEPGNFVAENVLHRKQWANRQARIRYIRAVEDGRVHAVVKELYTLSKNYRRLYRQLRHAFDYSAHREDLIEDLEAMALDRTRPYSEGDRIHFVQIVQLLSAEPFEEEAMIPELQALAFRGALNFTDVRPDDIARRLLDSVEHDYQPDKTLLFDLLELEPDLVAVLPLPLESNPANVRSAIKISFLAPEIHWLSRFRRNFFEHLVEEVALDQPLTSYAGQPAQTLFEVEFTAWWRKVRRGRDSNARQQYRQSTIFDNSLRRVFLAKANRLALAAKLPAFLREDLQRQILFVEDFDLPIDPIFWSYVYKLRRIAK